MGKLESQSERQMRRQTERKRERERENLGGICFPQLLPLALFPSTLSL